MAQHVIFNSLQPAIKQLRHIEDSRIGGIITTNPNWKEYALRLLSYSALSYRHSLSFK